ncbi:hypothetical protein C4577_01325 [Candidatus Parcubacteria bacterium]|nr:MAG: hypothetical protein C4577_01325 [Candidatus Parcubacteria bacterium]
MTIFIFNIFLIVAAIFLLILLSMIWPPDSPWSPWWRTNKNIARAACRLAKIKEGDTVYELGCGDASFLLTANKEYKAKTVGIEIDPVRFFIAKLRFALNKCNQSKLLKKDFFEVSLSDADVVFVYLVPKALEKLIPKFKKELKPKAKIVSLRYKINLPLLEEDKKSKLYLYKIS